MTTRRSALFIALVLVIAGCSGDDASSDSGGSSGSGDAGGDAEVAGAVPADVCALMTDAEVAQVTGETPASHRDSQVTPGYSNCQWSDGSSDFFTLTVQDDHDWDLLVTAAQSRGADEYRELPGVGERAFVELEANVIAEQNGLAVTAQGQVQTVGDLEALMPTVLDRLS